MYTTTETASSGLHQSATMSDALPAVVHVVEPLDKEKVPVGQEVQEFASHPIDKILP